MRKFILAAALLTFATPAAAYTSYLKPDQFWPTDGDVQVQGTFATEFFTPQIAIGEALTVYNPEGETVIVNTVAIAPEVTTLDTDLPASGTYRISSGEVLGQVATLVAIDGAWRLLADGEVAPEGAPTTTMQTATVAEVYVTRGEATRAVLDEPGGRLAIRPVTHPNQVLVSQGFQVQILFDDAPLAEENVILYAAGDIETDRDRAFMTDANGNATITFDAPGQYVIATRHSAEAPAGAEAAVRSYTTTVTIEAYDALPEVVEEAEVEEEAEEPTRRLPPARRRVGRPDY